MQRSYNHGVWEAVITERYKSTERLKVPNGWIYKVSDIRDETLSITFVPDKV